MCPHLAAAAILFKTINCRAGIKKKCYKRGTNKECQEYLHIMLNLLASY